MLRTYTIYDNLGKLGTQAAGNKNDAVHFFSHSVMLQPLGKKIPIIGDLVAYDILRDETPHTWEN